MSKENEIDLESIEKLTEEMRDFTRRFRLGILVQGAEPPCCSFCGHGHNQVELMIKGPGCNICSACVDLCAEILAAKRSEGQGT